MKNNITKSHKSKILTWVYPPNNWVSNYNKTFVYGWSNPKAKLFISVGAGLAPAQKIKIFPNGNFAQTIKLPEKKNVVSLVQIAGKKKTILQRKISVGAGPYACPTNEGDQKIRLEGEHIGSPQQKTRHFVIVIDPGHGGKEHGTHSPKGVPEKYFNLQIAKSLVEALHAAHSVSEPRLRRAAPLRGKIYLTRSTDKFISLKNRVNFAKKKNANILISIHHNALPDNKDPLKYRGVGIYYTHNFVKPFAKRLLQSISKESGLNKYGIFKRNFALTRPGFCQAVLIECGFLIHPLEGEYVTRRDIQKKIVKGIIKTILK